jgi:hypothetical protein
MRRLLPALFLAAALCLVPATSSAAVIQNVQLPLNVTFVNTPCTGDTITFTGNIHLVIAMTTDASGGFHLHFDNNVSGVTGVGVPSGTTYHGIGGGWFEVNANPPFPVIATETDVFGLISTGSSSNFVVTVTLHMTVNADGSITAQVMRISITCR